jgi:hypothetical protein
MIISFIIYFWERGMNVDDEAKATAKWIRDLLSSGNLAPYFPTTSTDPDARPTTEDGWNEFQKQSAAEIKRALEKAHAAGKAEGLREASLPK